MNDYVVPLEKLGSADVDRVGGKNSSLGEMIANLTSAGVRVPGGFATTAKAYRDFLARDGLDERIHARLDALDVDDVNTLAKTGREIRRWIVDTPFQAELEEAVETAWKAMHSEGEHPVAVRSSATAEDLPDASFAGQQETYLNVRGLDETLAAIKDVFASLFNDRAIAYRVHQGFAHRDVALSAGIQRMVRSDIGASGVLFTLDTETGFRDAVFITGAYGLGETVVQGAVNPDEFYVYKPGLAAGRDAILRRNLGGKAIKMVYSDVAGHDQAVVTQNVPDKERQLFCVTDEEVEELGRQAVIIEEHYGRPMDVEWAKDGIDGQLYIVQARPETVQSRSGQVLERYVLKGKSEVVASGRAIGQRIGAGTAKIILDLSEMDRIHEG
ncbi:MAG: phosphoenolpyruvate synthase, partial [Gammaproteobacteria bacterium]|nr:phosphoenolpyruvate synthase [Gammaproteobacteria bacterium]